MIKRFYGSVFVAFIALSIFIPSNMMAQNDPIYDDLLGQDRVNTITTAVPFLMIAPDARAGAKGDVGVSSRPDINSLHWNPAKFAFIDKEMGLGLSYTPWLRALVPDINLSYLSGFRRIDELQVVAASLIYFSLGDIQFTDETGMDQGTWRPNEFAIDVAYARKLSENFSGGIAARYIHSNLTAGQGGPESSVGRAFAADVSVYYERELEWNTPTDFSFGVNISNIGNKISYSSITADADFIPINLRLGPTFNFNLDDFNEIAISIDFNKLLVPTPPLYGPDGEILEGRNHRELGIVEGMFGSFSDAPNGFSEELNEITYGIGAEYWYDGQFAIRAGYFHEHETKGNRKYFSTGIGLKYNVFGLDFAYLVPLATRSPLENVLRFSLIFDFDALAAQQDRGQ